MDTKLDIYVTFYYVCKLKNITKVAEMMYLTQPAVSKQIKNLEVSLGKKLIIRNTTGIELTEDGIQLYDKIKMPIEELLQIESSYKDETDNYDVTIKIIAGQMLTKYYLIPAMTEFNKNHPQVKFETSTLPYSESIQKLRNGEADLIFLSSDEVTEEYNDIEIKDFIEIKDALVMHKDLKDKFSNKIDLKDLNELPIICTKKPSSSRAFIDNYFNSIGKTFTPKYETSSIWITYEYIMSKLGIGVITNYFLNDLLEKNELIELETTPEIPARKLQYAIRKNGPIHSVIRDLLKQIKSSL